MNKTEWTIETYALHNEEMRKVQNHFEEERDRRYTEVNIEKEKALKIKETADLAALSLARESQTYKEQQNDALRDKNLSESGIYAKNSDLSAAIDALKKSQEHAIGELVGKLQPFIDLVTQQQGVTKGSEITMGKLYGAIAAVGGIIGILVYFSK